jgi:hypothetical protein
MPFKVFFPVTIEYLSISKFTMNCKNKINGTAHKMVKEYLPTKSGHKSISPPFKLKATKIIEGPSNCHKVFLAAGKIMNLL